MKASQIEFDHVGEYIDKFGYTIKHIEISRALPSETPLDVFPTDCWGYLFPSYPDINELMGLLDSTVSPTRKPNRDNIAVYYGKKLMQPWLKNTSLKFCLIIWLSVNGDIMASCMLLTLIVFLNFTDLILSTTPSLKN